MDINKKIEGLMKDLQENIKDPKELEYINKKLAKTIVEIMEELYERTSNVERKISRIGEELYIPEYEDECEEFEIVCPYCNYVFEADIDELKTEVICPECNNVIELDWNEDDCHGNCSCCHGDCSDEDDGDNEIKF